MTSADGRAGHDSTAAARVSVLMPCYNAAATLPEALDSLAAQTLTDWELVAVDDGSTDDTPAVLAAWAQRNARLRVLTRPHGGILEALEPGAVLYRLRLPWAGLALALQALGLAVLALGLLQTDVMHFLGLRQLVEREAQPPRLVVSGLYRHVRHPLYTAGLAVLWFTPLLTASLLALNIAFTANIVIGSHLEERRLHAEFGPTYAAYARRVPRLLPRLRLAFNSD